MKFRKLKDNDILQEGDFVDYHKGKRIALINYIPTISIGHRVGSHPTRQAYRPIRAGKKGKK